MIITTDIIDRMHRNEPKCNKGKERKAMTDFQASNLVDNDL